MRQVFHVWFTPRCTTGINVKGRSEYRVRQLAGREVAREYATRCAGGSSVRRATQRTPHTRQTRVSYQTSDWELLEYPPDIPNLLPSDWAAVKIFGNFAHWHNNGEVEMAVCE
jgi:hypothetical protein